MLKNFSKNFNKLPLSNKSMVYLMWIYSAWSIITWFFINIYVFKLHNSFNEILIYNMISFTSIFIGFTIIWWIMSIIQRDIKNMYYLSYILFIISFIFIFIFKWTLFWVYLFWILYGIWTWVFWNAVHTQELKNIENKNRDFYSSSITAWNNLISIVNPLLIALIFYLANIFNFDWYYILFSILPLIYLTSFFFIKNINSYVPKKVKKQDFKNFFTLKRYKYGHLYFLIWWLIIWLSVAIIPIINLVILKNEINIGLYQWALTIISTFWIVHFSLKRKELNRFKYFSIFWLLLAINTLLFWFYFNFTYFIIYSIIWLLVTPLYRVSEHVYDLHLMDSIKVENSDFYPAMLMREVILWIWRIFALLGLFFINKTSIFSVNDLLKSGLFFLGISCILIIGSIYLWEKNEKDLN